jgi:hypothetical protein
MTTQEQVSKLQGLLARIQKNATKPRTSAPQPATTVAAASAPTATAAPFAPHPAPPPVAFASPAAMPAAPPAPMPVAPAPVGYAAPLPSPADQSVDDLLGGTDDGLSVDVDVPLDTIPPVAATPTQAPESEPIPLVAASVEQPLPPPIDDAFGLESEVSEVRMAPAPRESDVEVTVAAIEAEAEIIATEELSEADLVELTESPITSADADVDIDFEDEDQQAPASSQRSRVASSMDEALAAAADQNDVEHDVPLKTPPPESGPQEAPVAPAMAAAAAPDVDALLGEELEIPTRGQASPPAVPTAEQLGQTIELEEARGPSLELAEPVQSSVPPAGVEELEVALPPRDVVGGYDDSLMPPPEARDELEAHRRRQDDDFAPPPESLAQLPSIQPGAISPEIVPLARSTAPLQPEFVTRSMPTGSAESFISVRESFKPASFVELLDASLSLGGS